MPEALLLIPLYALADRFAGGGWPTLAARLPGRGAFWGAVVCAGAGWLVLGLLGALTALAWLIWRTPMWDVFGGSTDPRDGREVAGTLARHLLAAPGLALAAYWSRHDVLLAAVLAGGFALFATVLACIYAEAVEKAEDASEPIGNQNRYVELARGVAYGLAVFGIGLA